VHIASKYVIVRDIFYKNYISFLGIVTMTSCTIIIFGASGDLAKRKLIPAIYKLMLHNKFEKILIIGAAFDVITAGRMMDQAREFIVNLDESLWQKLLDHSYYQELRFDSINNYYELAKRVEDLEQEHDMSGNRLIYCAAAAHFFCSITHNSAQSGLIKHQKNLEHNKPIWHKIVYEKPFGYDKESAHIINECIKKYLDESQAYRIDHYLTKELVGNIALVRFTNSVFEPLWNNNYIDNVQIIVNEKLAVGNRGIYYDNYGALRDVVQNHMLELLALVAMEAPEQLSGEFIRDQRVQVLKKVTVIDGILGQYNGYCQEPGVAAHSQTDTFAQLVLTIKNSRWAGVPFYFKTGKMLDEHTTKIAIVFKHAKCLLLEGCPTESNSLIIRIAPEGSFELNLNAKKPNTSHDVVPVSMDFSHSRTFGPTTPEAYEVVLQEVIAGEQATSVRVDEIEEAWRIIDGIQKLDLPLYTYAPHTTGPCQAADFDKKYKITWKK